MAKWKFERRHGTCTPCERTFADGERFVSTLCNRAGELSREDLCTACWAQRDAAAEPAQEDLFWWFTHYEEHKKRTVQLDLGSLERLFFELEGRAEVSVRELRYVICLLLMRKRKLKVERIKRSEEGESFIVKRPRRDERYQVWVYDFSPERMAELRDEHAHRWLGFSEAQMSRMFDAVGLEGESPTYLEGDPLTVCIWVARKPALPANDRVPATEAL